MLRKALLLVLSLTLLSLAWAQTGSIQGIVKNSENGNPISGANVMLKGTSMGAASNSEGTFIINDVPVGQYEVVVSVIGFKKAEREVFVNASKQTNVNFEVTPSALNLEELHVVASYADEETPVTHSNVSKMELKQTIGSRDIPLALNTTPNVYATSQGGGSGDADIKIRGFNQENVAVMINGVPVNDMENGWVYWSNWAGLSDVTSSIQIQRGIGASSLAISSVGGTMNIITDPSQLSAGGNFKQTVGSGDYLQSSFSYNTGLINDKFAASVAVARTTRSGIIDKTWTDAWSYYGAFSYNINEKNKVDLFVVGAPQQHGQRVYEQNISTFDADYAKDLDSFDPGALDAYGEDHGLDYNQHWGPYDADYEEYYALWTTEGSRHDQPSNLDNSMMTETNYYHKPQANLNWYYDISEDLHLKNVAYYSQGIGGGTGEYGVGLYMYPLTDNGQYPLNMIHDINKANIDSSISTTESRSQTVMRNSVNQHTWYGDILTVNYNMNEHLDFTGGLDLRYYKGEHFREIRNMLGGDYFVDNSNFNSADTIKEVGDLIDYHNDGLVQWYGGFGNVKGEYGKINTFVSAAYAIKSYKRVDYFIPADPGSNKNSTGWASFPEWNFKIGATYNLSNIFNVYGNFGYISKAPIFDDVYDYSNNKTQDINNEKISIVEAGLNYNTALTETKISVYNTNWMDRSWPTFSSFDGVDYRFLLKGIDARHTGLEIETLVDPHPLVDFKLSGTFSNNEWLNDVTATFTPEDERVLVPDTAFVYTEGLKVGGAPQKAVSLSTILKPVVGSSINFTYQYYWDFYSDFDPNDRTNEPDHPQPWKIPNYGKLNIHASYQLPYNMYGTTLTLRFHAFNVLDTKYISDATDNSPYEAYDFDHDADDAGVYFGLPRRMNLSLEIGF